MLAAAAAALLPQPPAELLAALDAGRAAANAARRQAYAPPSALRARALLDGDEEECADTPDAFPAMSLCFGSDECDAVVDFLSAAMGSASAVCEMGLLELSEEITNRPWCPNPLVFPPTTTASYVFELCPASCSKTGFVVLACAASQPTPPPAYLDGPGSPPSPPLGPGSSPFQMVSTIVQVRRAVREAQTLGSSTVYIQPGATMFLGGAPIVVGPCNLTMASNGSGATLDAQQLSRIFVVEGGSRLHLRSIVLANGFSFFHGGALRIGRAIVTLSACSVINSTAFLSGGAMLVALGTLVLTDGTSVLNSFSYGLGGAILSSISNVEVSNRSSISGAVATLGGVALTFRCSFRVAGHSFISDVRAHFGAAFVGSSSNLEMTEGSVVKNGFAYVFGGGYYATDSTMTLSDGSSFIDCVGTTGGSVYVGGFAGFTMTDGSSIVGSHAEVGGAVYVTGGRFTMANGSSIVGSSASADGGAILLAGGISVISRSSIANTSAHGSGGAIAMAGGALLMTKRSSVVGSTSLLGGGAVFMDGGSFILAEASSIIRSTTSADGGAFYMKLGSLVITNGSSIDSSSSTYGGGGGVILGGDLLITNRSAIVNCAGTQGGAFIAYGGRVRLDHGSMIVGTSATEFGGAISIHSGIVEFSNGSTIFGARAGRAGGAVYFLDGALMLQNATISSCTAGVEGSLLYSRGNAGGTSLLLLTHTEFQLSSCDSVFAMESPMQIVFRNVTLTPLLGCDASLLLGIDASVVSTECDTTYVDPDGNGRVGVCTAHASCQPQEIVGTPLKGVICSCEEPNELNPDFEVGIASYISDLGCLRPRKMRDVYAVFRTLSFELFKPHTPTSVFNLSLEMQGEHSQSPLRWMVRNYSDMMSWLRLPNTSGLADDDVISIDVHLSAIGIAERSVPYAGTLLISVGPDATSPLETRAVPISLFVRAETSFLVWVSEPPAGVCPPSLSSGLVVITGSLLRVPFTGCDEESLPIDHQLPTSWDSGVPRVRFITRGSSRPVPTEYSTSGTYNALLTSEVHGEFLLDLTLKSSVATLAGHAICPLNRVEVTEGRCGCPEGYFENVEKAECELCSADGASSFAGSVGSEGCAICREGFFRSQKGGCLSCPAGASCPRNSTLATIQTLEGHWRLSSFSSVVYKCDSQDGHQTSCRGGNAGSDSCYEGHTGPLCQVCLSQNQYFDGGYCRDCPSKTTIAIVFPIFFLIVLSSFFGAYLYFRGKPARHSGALGRANQVVRNVRGHQQMVGLIPKTKILLAFAQIIASLHSTFSLLFPEWWFRWTQVLRFFGEIDWMSWMAPPECIVGNDMATIMILRALTPLSAICAIPPFGAAFSVVRLWWKSPVEGCANFATAAARGALSSVPLALFLTFCFTPAVSASVFEAWNCIGFSYSEDEELTFLDRDLSVRCDDSPEHNYIIRTAWVFVAIWPIGMVVIYIVLLLPCRHLLDSNHQENLLVKATTFLHRDYKSSYFWWEVVFLLYRTTLTGWLLLVGNPIRIVRLLIALFLSVGYLVALLECQPYKRKSDSVLASWAQVLLICIFGNGILVQAYSSISSDTAGSPQLAQRFLGLTSTDDVVVIMIVCTFSMILLFLSVLGIGSYSHQMQQRLDSKWTVCSLNPPRVRSWKSRGFYACFLSHYKMGNKCHKSHLSSVDGLVVDSLSQSPIRVAEAASDARYLHDMLRKMLRSPVFIDSVALNDLRKLISEGVHASDVVLLLATKGVLTRPWCLLELLETFRRGIPIIIVNIAAGGFEADAARRFMDNFEEQMMLLNPSGLSFLQRRLGSDLSELKRAIFHVLDDNEGGLLTFDSSSGDHAIVASAQDIVEKMATKLGFAVQWEQGSLKSRRARLQMPIVNRLTRLLRPFSRAADQNRTIPIVVSCARDDHHRSDARVLCAALSVKLDNECVLGGFEGSIALIESCEVVVAILTRRFLSDPVALCEVYMACRLGVPLVTVNIIGSGYDFAEASAALSNLSDSLSSKDPGLIAQMQAKLPMGVEVDVVGEVLYHHLMAIITCPWMPSSSHQLRGLVSEIVARMRSRRLSSRRESLGLAQSNAPPLSSRRDPRELVSSVVDSSVAEEDSFMRPACPRVLSDPSSRSTPKGTPAITRRLLPDTTGSRSDNAPTSLTC